MKDIPKQLVGVESKLFVSKLIEFVSRYSSRRGNENLLESIGNVNTFSCYIINLRYYRTA